MGAFLTMMHVASITGIAIDLTHENIPTIHPFRFNVDLLAPLWLFLMEQLEPKDRPSVCLWRSVITDQFFMRSTNARQALTSLPHNRGVSGSRKQAFIIGFGCLKQQ